MIDKKSWNEFRASGLLWFANSILHLFGWAIVIKMDGDNVLEVFPARVSYRGFSEESNEKGYIKVTRFLQENINVLLKESEE